uniref:Uncharacterized protein n=1 Tax=Lotharella globosa TaxID=91324 RepID=A0A7S3Z5B3_9EUKA
MVALLLTLLALRHSGASWSASSDRTNDQAPASPGGYWTRGADQHDERGHQKPASNKSKPDSEDFYKIESIASGEDHTCVLLSGDGGLRCWGSGFYGQLLSGSSDNIGDDINERNAIPQVDLGTNEQAVQVAAGAAHTCVILSDGNVKCWGWGVCGQTGYGHTSTLGDEPSETGDNLRPVDLGGRKAVRLALGETHSCAILDDQSVRCWGCNNERQLGVQSPVPDDMQGFPMPSALSPLSGVDRPVLFLFLSDASCVHLVAFACIVFVSSSLMCMLVVSG